MFQTTYYEINSPKLAKSFHNFRIAHLSDLHGSLHGPGNSDLIHQIYKEHPDIVVMTGDMADDSKHAVTRAKHLCLRLRKHYPVYYVVGNHEQTLPDDIRKSYLSELKSAGVVVLDNNFCEINRTANGQTDQIRLYGLVTPMVYYKDIFGEYQRGAHFSARDTRDALGHLDPAYYNILLAHNPLYFPSYRDWGADLTLSGHIHGGIIQIPKLGGLFSPDMRFFPTYDAGQFTDAGKHLVVSRGLGNNFLTRINNPEELVVIILKTHE